MDDTRFGPVSLCEVVPQVQKTAAQVFARPQTVEEAVASSRYRNLTLAEKEYLAQGATFTGHETETSAAGIFSLDGREIRLQGRLDPRNAQQVLLTIITPALRVDERVNLRTQTVVTDGHGGQMRAETKIVLQILETRLLQEGWVEELGASQTADQLWRLVTWLGEAPVGVEIGRETRGPGVRR